ncbi:MAG TPA: glycosyltransferase [Cyclobacteriaceae bacterium]|nr:glycosyltransferase [Cyclobacteriaceae bacterium]
MLFKLWSFLRFVALLARQIVIHRPSWILVYDPMALLAYRLVAWINLYGSKLWYHNHDVFEPSMVRKFSIQSLAGHAEQGMFAKIDLFTLPADERKKNFPMHQLAGIYHLVPNYPARRFYDQFYKPRQLGTRVRLIFQGAISEGHGFEEIIDLLHCKVSGRSLHLTLIGFVNEKYKDQLLARAEQAGVADRLDIQPYVSYVDLPGITKNHDIGLGIYAKSNDFHLSLGKASNKMYEYAAVGLPILVFDNSHFRGHLGSHRWVFFTDLSKTSLLKQMEELTQNYEQRSLDAHQDFIKALNFEAAFDPIRKHLEQLSGEQ